MTAVDVAGFFRNVWARIGDAEEAADEISERWFHVAGCTLRLRFIGSALIGLVAPALSHLEVTPSRREADLTVHCWDCESLGVDFPMAPVTIEAFTPRGEVRGLNDCRFRAAYQSGGRQLSLMDADRRQAVYCVGAGSRIPRFEVAEPIRVILYWFMLQNQRLLLHAGAVGTPDGGVLLIGRSGAGKSNTALGCFASELRYASDDFCAVSADRNPMVYSVYGTGKTREQDWERHPFLSGLAPNRDSKGIEKVIYFLNDASPEKLIASFPLKAILVLRRADEPCEIRRIPPGAVLRLAAPDTARLLPDAAGEVLRGLARLVRAVPCFEFSLGSRPALIPRAISELLAKGPATVL